MSLRLRDALRFHQYSLHEGERIYNGKAEQVSSMYWKAARRRNYQHNVEITPPGKDEIAAPTLPNQRAKPVAEALHL